MLEKFAIYTNESIQINRSITNFFFFLILFKKSYAKRYLLSMSILGGLQFDELKRNLVCDDLNNSMES